MGKEQLSNSNFWVFVIIAHLHELYAAQLRILCYLCVCICRQDGLRQTLVGVRATEYGTSYAAVISRGWRKGTPWGPKEFKKWNHPLAIMVWIHDIVMLMVAHYIMTLYRLEVSV